MQPEALIKRISDLYLDLGVAIAELKKHNRQAPRANNGIQDRVKAKFKASPGIIMNMHQMAAELGECPKAVGKAMMRLKNKRFLKRIGAGAYVYERKETAKGEVC